MKNKRPFRPVTPRFLDERSRHIQLLVIRDAFVTILLLALLVAIGFVLFRSFILANLGSICLVAIICVGVVALLSSLARGGWNWEEKRSFAKGELILAPFAAILFTFLLVSLTDDHPSLSGWLLWYIVILLSSLVYPLFVLWRSRNLRNM